MSPRGSDLRRDDPGSSLPPDQRVQTRRARVRRDLQRAPAPAVGVPLAVRHGSRGAVGGGGGQGVVVDPVLLPADEAQADVGRHVVAARRRDALELPDQPCSIEPTALRPAGPRSASSCRRRSLLAPAGARCTGLVSLASAMIGTLTSWYDRMHINDPDVVEADDLRRHDRDSIDRLRDHRVATGPVLRERTRRGDRVVGETEEAVELDANARSG